MVLILICIFIPFIPLAVELLQLLFSGDLNWPMEWRNEVIVWGALLSPVALVGFWLNVKINNKYISLLSLLVFVFFILQPIIYGVSASSKIDSPQLQLVAFWTLQWKYW